ncbi:MAG TPA: hypothetical protein VGU43_04520 [Thermoplasmata archaeon]|nr:hypothetical protein [Thermoplasmata archaeon]
MRILDATAGNRGVWFDKNYRDATFIDIRAKGETSELKQDNLVLDCRNTRFPDGSFDLVIFDPPHIAIGPNAEMAKRYGSLPNPPGPEPMRSNGGYPSLARCDVGECTWTYRVPERRPQSRAKSAVYMHLANHHGLRGRLRMIAADRICMRLQVPE